jgi:small-conductance mechanosensitive channel
MQRRDNAGSKHQKLCSAYMPRLLLFVTGLLFAATVIAQAAAILDTALVEQRLNALRESGNADDSEIVIAYDGVKRILDQAESYHREAANYVETMTTAPQQEAKIQRRIDAHGEVKERSESLEILSSEALKAQLVQTRTKLGEANSKLATLDRRLAARETNANTIRDNLGEVNARIESLPDESFGLDPAAQPSLVEAQEWLVLAERLALSAERRALEVRLTSQPARYSVMAVERAEVALNVEYLVRGVRELEGHLQGRVAQVVDAESLGIQTGSPAFSLSNRLVAHDSELRAERIAVHDNLAGLRSQIAEIDRQSRAVADRFATARRMGDFAAESDIVGGVLLAYWREAARYQPVDPTANLAREAGGSVVRRIELEEELRQLSSATGYINYQLEAEGLAVDAISPQSHTALVELVRAYRERLRAVIASESDYIESLRTLGENYRALVRLVDDYESYLKSQILWIPAYPPLWQIDWGGVPAELEALRKSFQSISVIVVPKALLWLVISTLLFLRRRRLGIILQELNGRIARPRDDSIGHTLRALFCVVQWSLALPLLLLGIGTALSPAVFGVALSGTALALFVMRTMQLLCGPAGVGTLHFNWPQQVTANTYRELRWLIRWWLPLPLVTFLMVRTTLIASGEAVLVRYAMMAMILMLLMLLGGALIRAVRQVGWVGDHGNQLRLGFMIVLIALAAIIVQGHVYSVDVVFIGLAETLLIGFCLLLVHAVLLRWVAVTRRRLRMAELIEAREEAGSVEDALLDERVANLGDLSDESSQLINVGIAAAAIATLFYIWSPMLPAFEAFSEITLWTSTTMVEGQPVDNRISLAMLLVVGVLASLTIFGARKLPALIDLVLRSRTSVSASARYTVSTLVNYVIVGSGIVAGLSALGLQWSQLQWLVAALGVGIGFGLQEIIANFISGLIILFERPIRVGDFVSTGGSDGFVTRIRIRATTICDLDGKELLVPNKEFITGRLLNWSLSDPKIRIILPVGIAYGSDAKEAAKIISNIVRSHPRVVEEPEPQIVFESFGDNALQLSARCFLNSLEKRLAVVTELNHEIYRQLKEAGIVIAFPQRDIHFDADKPLRIALEEKPGPAD